jgi:CheY-like chemotaxis protein
VVTVGGKGSDLLECRIRDTGIGIAGEDLEQLFQSFTQVDSSTTRKYGGTGLGLNICSKLVKLMGGTIAVESQPGQGTCFTVTLPLRIQESQDKRPVWMEPDTAELKGRTLLLFVGNATLGRALERRLRYYGLTVSLNPSCETIAAAGQPDLLLMDGGFPGQLRQGERDCLAALETVQPPVVLLPVAMPYLLTDCRFGRDPVILRKPVTVEALFSALTSREVMSGRVEKQGNEPAGAESPGSAELADSPRVLIAEDNRTNQILALKFLASLKIRGDVADNGAEALRLLRKSRYDLVFMDMRMPEMDGMEVTRRIRAELPADHQAKIVAMTANVSQQDREDCQAAGMDDFVAKPFSRADFERVLAPWLGSRPPDETSVSLLPAEPLSAGEGGSAVPVFVDVNKFAELCQLNEELASPDDEISMLEELFNAFHEQAPESIALMGELAARKEVEAVAAEAHKLRGLCLNLGLNAMAALAETIENTNGDDPAAQSELVNELESCHTRTNAALSVILPGSCRQHDA